MGVWVWVGFRLFWEGVVCVCYSFGFFKWCVGVDGC